MGRSEDRSAEAALPTLREMFDVTYGIVKNVRKSGVCPDGLGIIGTKDLVLRQVVFQNGPTGNPVARVEISATRSGTKIERFYDVRPVDPRWRPNLGVTMSVGIAFPYSREYALDHGAVALPLYPDSLSSDLGSFDREGDFEIEVIFHKRQNGTYGGTHRGMEVDWMSSKLPCVKKHLGKKPTKVRAIPFWDHLDAWPSASGDDSADKALIDSKKIEAWQFRAHHGDVVIDLWIALGLSDRENTDRYLVQLALDRLGRYGSKEREPSGAYIDPIFRALQVAGWTLKPHVRAGAHKAFAERERAFKLAEKTLLRLTKFGFQIWIDVPDNDRRWAIDAFSILGFEERKGVRKADVAKAFEKLEEAAGAELTVEDPAIKALEGAKFPMEIDPKDSSFRALRLDVLDMAFATASAYALGADEFRFDVGDVSTKFDARLVLGGLAPKARPATIKKRVNEMLRVAATDLTDGDPAVAALKAADWSGKIGHKIRWAFVGRAARLLLGDDAVNEIFAEVREENKAAAKQAKPEPKSKDSGPPKKGRSGRPAAKPGAKVEAKPTNGGGKPILSAGDATSTPAPEPSDGDQSKEDPPLAG